MHYELLHGDCVAMMSLFVPDASVDSIVTDPPYELGFMGKGWDSTGIANSVEMWREAYRVLKPGGHLLAFSGTRTYHRMVCAIEDAGFEIRDSIYWHYASGFPKSLNLDNERGRLTCGCDDQLHGVRQDANDARGMGPESENTELQPAVQRRAPRPGVGGARVEGRSRAQDLYPIDGREESSVEGWRDAQTPEGQLQGCALRARTGMGEADGEEGRLHHGASSSDGADVRLPSDPDGGGRSRGPRPEQQHAGQSQALPNKRGSQTWGGWPLCGGCGKPRLPRGLGTALKPATEPIVVARKPLIGTVAANVLAHGTGALNIDGCRVEGGPWKAHSATGLGSVKFFTEGEASVIDKEPHALGRWPANLIHDGSDEVLAAFPWSKDGVAGARTGQGGEVMRTGLGAQEAFGGYRGEGSAARFFYAAKASKKDRNSGGVVSTHPTVKPTDLMRYLCRLVTPPGGTVLDPFMGSGSTGRAAMLEGFEFIGCELSAEYLAIAEARIADAAASRLKVAA